MPFQEHSSICCYDLQLCHYRLKPATHDTAASYDKIEPRRCTIWLKDCQAHTRYCIAVRSSVLIMSDQNVILACVALCIIKDKKTTKGKRRFWCKNWLIKRGSLSHNNSLEELRLHPEDWRNYLRMDETTYVELLSAVTPLIEKKDTVMRRAISSHERLTATLR